MIVFLLFYSCNSLCQQKCLFCGNWRWEKNDEKHDFTIQILQRDTVLFGKHCYILDAGNKMDCSKNNNDFSFKFNFTTSDSIIFRIKSYYSNDSGKVCLTIKGDKLYWKLIQKPKEEYYLPREAILIK
jgi:hypothetical protein